MRWRWLGGNSSVATDEIQSLSANSSVITDEFTKINTISAVTTAKIPSDDEIRQLRMANYVESSIYNPDFNYGEFATIRNQAGLNSFKISVKEFVARTGAISLQAKAGIATRI